MRLRFLAAVALAWAAAASPAAADGPLDRPGVAFHWAFVDYPAVVRVAPSYSAGHVGRLPMRTADGTSALVAVEDERGAGGPDPWMEVRWPTLPNGVQGWVPASALGGLRSTSDWLQVSTTKLTALLWHDGHVVFGAPVGVGKPSTPTPRGDFFVIDRLQGFAPGTLYGPLAFGTSARSSVLTDWPKGGVIGIHGTNEPRLVPGRPSHGCIRMRNADILRLGRLLRVGTPVTIS